MPATQNVDQNLRSASRFTVLSAFDGAACETTHRSGHMRNICAWLVNVLLYQGVLAPAKLSGLNEKDRY